MRALLKRCWELKKIPVKTEKAVITAIKFAKRNVGFTRHMKAKHPNEYPQKRSECGTFERLDDRRVDSECFERL